MFSKWQSGPMGGILRRRIQWLILQPYCSSMMSCGTIPKNLSGSTGIILSSARGTGRWRFIQPLVWPVILTGGSWTLFVCPAQSSAAWPGWVMSRGWRPRLAPSATGCRLQQASLWLARWIKKITTFTSYWAMASARKALSGKR